MYQAFSEVFEGAPEIVGMCYTRNALHTQDGGAFCERLKEFNPQLKIERESSSNTLLELSYVGSHEVHFAQKGPLRLDGVPQEISRESHVRRTSDELTFLR